MKNKFFLILTMAVFMTLLFSSCNKEDSEPSNPTNGKTTAVFNSSLTYGSMTDQDGNVYKTITIGTQTWMAENLRSAKYNDGTSIPNITSSEEWNSLSTGAYCNYNNTTNLDTITTYGRLYNWYSVNTGKLAPNGWHVPTDSDWQTLISYLGENAGGKLKEVETTHWQDPNSGATNETGFTALPAGGRLIATSFISIGGYGGWWSSISISNTYAYYHEMCYSNNDFLSKYTEKHSGLSIRCIKD